MNKYLAELIGTYFLVLTIGCTAFGKVAVVAPLAIGSALMVMVYAGGHVSGGHFNPAVTLGVWLRGRCPGRDVLPYWIAQVIGSLLAAQTARYLYPGVELPVLDVGETIGQAFIAELVFTFALVYVVLNAATSKETAGNSFYGLAIGFTVLTGAFAVGGISGGAFNPAVVVGITVMGLAKWAHFWMYLLANFVGGALAAWAFKVINHNDR